MRPFDIAADAVSKPIANAWYGITHYDELKAENEALTDQIEHEKGAEIEAQTAITKYYELLKLYHLTSVHSYKSVIAQVVGEAPSNFQNTVEITVGTRAGVAVGMPVTDGAGLDRQGHQGLSGSQRRDADHRSAVLRAGAGPQQHRRGRRGVDHIVDHPEHGPQRPVARHHDFDQHHDNHYDVPSTTTTRRPRAARRPRRARRPPRRVRRPRRRCPRCSSPARPATSTARAPIGRCCSV